MTITSKSNPLIKKVSSLYEKKFRKECGEFVVESVKLVKECVGAGLNVRQIICTENLKDIFTEAVVVSDELFKYISSEKSPQGVLAVVSTPQKKLTSPFGDCLLLDRIQDPGNLGTIIRTANAAGFDDIYLVGCTDPYSPKALRASMGGAFRLNLYECDLHSAFSALSETPIICADMDGEDVFSFTPPKSFCLCVGNEGGGIAEEIFSRARYRVKIPMRASCESLNAAISAAVCMYTLKNNLKGAF